METSNDVDTSKFLEKGPDYLRKQMELETETKGRLSAVERLAATKPKYVKSQQVVNSTQEPLISVGSASISSNGSSNRSSNRGGKLLTDRNAPATQSAEQSASQEQDNVVRRSSSKKRPDSLLLYRQKCELMKGSSGARNRRNLTRRLLRSSLDKNAVPEATGKECKTDDRHRKLTPEGLRKEFRSKTLQGSEAHLSITEVTEQNTTTEDDSADDSDPKPNVSDKPCHRRLEEVQRRNRKGVARSHSDISSRYSKNFADFDSFFTYCGLGGDVIESLGKENFSARSDEFVMIRSVSVSMSDDGFSRNSDDSDGLQEDQLHKSVRQGTSVIERNARIIKWLYSCKNATETGKKLRDLD